MSNTMSAPVSPVVTPPSSRPSGSQVDLQDDEGKEVWRRWTRQEVESLRAREPSVSPWWVVAAQAGTGMVAALLAGLITGRTEVAWSLLYGAATVVVPGVLMARGMTSRLSSVNAGASAVSFMLWEFVKILVSVAMLALAGRIVPSLSWPALLVGLVLGMKVYWVALLWRRRPKGSEGPVAPQGQQASTLQR